MPALPASIPLLRFCVGPMYFGIAAEDVVAVAPTSDEVIHIGAILGLEPGPVDRRMIHLATLSGRGEPYVSFQADQPVDVVRCSAEDILPMPPGVPPDTWKPVIGFARIAEQLILLLDIPSVIEKLMDTREGGPS